MKVMLLIIFGLLSTLHANEQVIYTNFNDVFKPSLSKDAIIRDEKGFEQDFLLIHSLIREYNPGNIFEIGTCEGKGTYIIKNAIKEGVVYSLELPPGEGPYNIPKERIGSRCKLPYVQLLGDSMTFDYTRYFPIDSWFIDGWHDYEHVLYETEQAMLSNPNLIMWHDTDIPEVFKAVQEILIQHKNYKVFRVLDTRMTFAVKTN